jgi:hypothetical protein
MDRNEGRIRDQVSIWSEQSAGEIEALLDIRADSSLLEGSPHRLRDAHEAVGEERQENRIGTFARRLVRMMLGRSSWRLRCSSAGNGTLYTF